MLKNYFKIAWRNLWKNKVFAAINIIGLSAGIAFALLVGAYVWNELQINHSLKNFRNQYFLQSEWKDPNMGNALTTLAPLAKRLATEYPNLVANYYRWDGITSVVSKGDKHFRQGIQLGDSTLLSMYGFRLLAGDAKTALTRPYTMVILKETAIKFFGKTDVVGQTLSVHSFAGGDHDFLVTGVLDNIPESSVTQINAANHNAVFIPTDTYTYFGRTDFESWNNTGLPSYVELRDGITAKDLTGSINSLIQKNAPDIIKNNLIVHPVPLSDYYLDKDNGLVKKMLFTLSLIGLFILLMAVVNFINIAISSAGKRTKEIGVRKVLGSHRSQLIIQFLTESFILVAFSTLLAIAGYTASKTVFAGIIGKELPALSIFPWQFLFIPILLIVVVALLAGTYPAFILSSLKTADAVKGKLTTVKEKVVLRKSLVGFQFCIALIVLIAASIITQQVTHFFGKGLGYNKEYMVSSQVPRDWSRKGVMHMETVRSEFAAMPQVSDVTLSYEIPNGMNGGAPPVYKPGTDSAKAVSMMALITDEHYLSAYQIPLKEGSFFNGHGLDSGKVIISERAVRAMGYKDNAGAVGQQLRIAGDPTVFTIKGVVQDFHFGSMQQQPDPIIFFNVYFAPTYRYFSFKIKPGNVHAAIAAIEKKWLAVLPGSSFEYSFMDDTLKALYATEMQIEKAAYTATGLSLIIMLLGVLGLISLSIQKRIKEIGIRKVLGASVPGIISLFVKEFMVIIILAAVIAIPVATLIMHSWLNNYADRIDISPQPFVLSVMILSLATMVLICVQTISTAMASPVKSLRTE